MAISPINNYGIKFISQLANNSDSIVPMVAKDTVSNAAIVATYAKEGGKDDARERFIEEFGTGAAWTLGIPFLKKVMDKTLYPFFKLNPDMDCRNLAPEFIEKAKNAKNITKNEKNIFDNLNKNIISKYKGVFASKFLISTTLSALALLWIIKEKQKSTQKRIEKEINDKIASQTLLNNTTDKEKLVMDFNSKLKSQKQSKDIAFKGGLGNYFLYNPVGNMMILDGVITTTRLKEARKGERFEVGLKEGFQIAMIYFLARPIQNAFEKIGQFFKKPIGLDPALIFDKNLGENLNSSKDKIESLLNAVKSMKKDEAFKYLKESIYNLDLKEDKSLLELLDKNGVINLVKDKNNNIEGLSYLNHIEGKRIKKSLEDFKTISSHLDNLKGIKAYKVFSVIANVLLSAWLIGVIQPKLTILLRKKLHNGDNRNPAIVAQEEEMMKSQLQKVKLQ